MTRDEFAYKLCVVVLDRCEGVEGILRLAEEAGVKWEPEVPEAPGPPGYIPFRALHQEVLDRKGYFVSHANSDSQARAIAYALNEVYGGGES